MEQDLSPRCDFSFHSKACMIQPGVLQDHDGHMDKHFPGSEWMPSNRIPSCVRIRFGGIQRPHKLRHHEWMPPNRFSSGQRTAAWRHPSVDAAKASLMVNLSK